MLADLPFDVDDLDITEEWLGREARKRIERKRQGRPGGLIEFVKYFWPVLEPRTKFVNGWAIQAICEHLEAVTFGDINRLLINVPPGFCKSLLTDVFWPAWEWSAMNMPHLRYVSFSYSAGLTERDNSKFRDLLQSQEFQQLYGDRFALRKTGETKITNDKTGSRIATSVGGIGTGERGDRAIVDDPHNVKESESKVVREETVRWFRESLQNRLNDMSKSAIVVIMQRVHEADVSGTLLNDMGGYVHLQIQMEYDWTQHTPTVIGWNDPRGCDDDGNPLVTISEGDSNRYPISPLAEAELNDRNGWLAWEDRFPTADVDGLKQALGPYAYAAQYQQRPQPKGGGIFKREWWQLWDSPTGKFPPFDYVLASLDGAFTEREENDPSALTVWGVWTEHTTIQLPTGKMVEQAAGRKVMLIDAWRKHLPMHGKRVNPTPDEQNGMLSGDPEERRRWQRLYDRRTQKDWGLIEWVAYTCRRWQVDKLLIEAKASGITAGQEMQRLFGDERWSVQLEQVKGDKVARALSVVPAWSQMLVYAPDRDWAEMVISEMEKFPKDVHDDLTDSATQAFKHLRAVGLIQHPDERVREDRRAMEYRPARLSQPLYPV